MEAKAIEKRLNEIGVRENTPKAVLRKGESYWDGDLGISLLGQIIHTDRICIYPDTGEAGCALNSVGIRIWKPNPDGSKPKSPRKYEWLSTTWYAVDSVDKWSD